MSEKKEYIERKDLMAKEEIIVTNTGREVCVIRTCNINAIPAADVEPVVRGEWQKVYENTTFGAMYRCSVCGETTFNVENFKYCPKCGTRMRMERSGSGE